MTSSAHRTHRKHSKNIYIILLYDSRSLRRYPKSQFFGG